MNARDPSTRLFSPVFAFRDASSIPPLDPFDVMSSDRIISIRSIPYRRHPKLKDIVSHTQPVGTMKRRRPDPLPTLQTGKIYKLPGERVSLHTNISKWLTRSDPSFVDANSPGLLQSPRLALFLHHHLAITPRRLYPPSTPRQGDLE